MFPVDLFTMLHFEMNIYPSNVSVMKYLISIHQYFALGSRHLEYALSHTYHNFLVVVSKREHNL